MEGVIYKKIIRATLKNLQVVRYEKQKKHNYVKIKGFTGSKQFWHQNNSYELLLSCTEPNYPQFFWRGKVHNAYYYLLEFFYYTLFWIVKNNFGHLVAFIKFFLSYIF